MQMGMISLGRMGANMTQRLLEGGHSMVVYDRSEQAVAESVGRGAVGGTSCGDVATKLQSPKVIWIMVPSGGPTEQTIQDLLPHLDAGDVLIDGGNSNFHDSQRRSKEVAEQGIHYLDAGTSGGVWGLKNGYCLMVGGAKEAFDLVEPLIKTLAPPDGYAHVGPSGAGHFAKMIHNGIEYGMLQAYGEGFEILEKSDYDFDLSQLCHLWMRGSVVRSWILELAENAFSQGGDELEGIKGYVEDSGEGRWTVLEAIDKSVPAPILTHSLLARFASRQEESFSAKVIAALRNQFGGHAIRKE